MVAIWVYIERPSVSNGVWPVRTPVKIKRASSTRTVDTCRPLGWDLGQHCDGGDQIGIHIGSKLGRIANDLD